MTDKCFKIGINGLVQGVGFRPFIYRLANEMSLKGSVENNNSGVLINVNCNDRQLKEFIMRIRREAPEISNIVSVDYDECDSHIHDRFIINGSSADRGVTQISPDIAVCDKCLQERTSQPHRIMYPFINCTYCGPRFSIIDALPYDRPNTTMKSFELCGKCRGEYSDPADRRFHAQPVACNECGPHYTYRYGFEKITVYSNVLGKIVSHIKEGGIVALKSIGGYNLICNARCDEAVQRLRAIKQRPRKPFAIMVHNLAHAQQIAYIDSAEKDALTSWRRPVVILDAKKSLDLKYIAPRYSTVGVMLPYMPVHYDLFPLMPDVMAIVVTSGNKGNEPIMTSDLEAEEYFGSLDIPVVSYNREIYNRIDDSVVRVIDGRMRVFRRARGFIPEPVFDSGIVDGVFAAGAEIISHFAFGCGNQIIESQYIGSLEKEENVKLYSESYTKMKSLFSIEPKLVITDAHPGYVATRLGEGIARGTAVCRMWHHHAHAVSVMVEYGIDKTVLALCLDGTGFGPDGTIWGGELLKCDRDKFERLYNMVPVPMPGGDVAAIQGWRMAVSLFVSVYGNADKLPESFVKRIGIDKIRVIEKMVQRKINSPLTSGAGRIFDAVASLIGVSDNNTYEAEAPVLLEQITDRNVTDFYPFNSDRGVDYACMLDGILGDMKGGTKVSAISAKFHNTLVNMWINIIKEYSLKEGIQVVLLTGGVMQNKIVASNLLRGLENAGLTPMLPSMVPCNDGGIAIGQVAYGASILNNKDYYA